jgi:hypothetical protein
MIFTHHSPERMNSVPVKRAFHKEEQKAVLIIASSHLFLNIAPAND